MNQKITTVQLFVTCLVDKFYPETGFATVEILENLGLTVEFPQAQTCCGQPAYNGGYWDEARAMARYTVNLLAQSEAPIVVPSGSCAEMIAHHYPALLADDPAAATAANVAGRTYELTQFLVDVLGVTNLHTACPGSVAYHASCHGLRGLGLRHHPRRLLQNVDEQILQQHRADRLLAWDAAELNLPGLDAALQNAGINIEPDEIPTGGSIRAKRLKRLAGVTVGLTGAQGGLADTGSLALSSGAGRGRLASLLPPVHIALLPRERLYPTLAHFLAAYGDSAVEGGNLVLITGPSRTADIEMTLSLGVHGPGDLHVIIFPEK